VALPTLISHYLPGVGGAYHPWWLGIVQGSAMGLCARLTSICFATGFLTQFFRLRAIIARSALPLDTLKFKPFACSFNDAQDCKYITGGEDPALPKI
jgi:hypothetical protein